MVERFDLATVHTCGQEPRGEMIPFKDGEFVLYSDYEAALRAGGEPVGVLCAGCGSSWDDARLAEEKAKRPSLISCCPERKMVPVYAHPAPSDLERELDEARAGIERLTPLAVAYDYLESPAGREKAEAERDALAADNARLVAALHLAVDLVERDVIRVRPSDRDELMAALAIWQASSASIPAPASADRAEARREALEEACGAVGTLTESLQEGLMTDADLTGADREAMKHQITALNVAAAAIREGE